LSRAKYRVVEEINVEDVAEKTEGFSGAEIGAICREAAMKAMEEYEASGGQLSGISAQNLAQALRESRPRTSSDSIRYFENFAT
jgi:SpoVK/Ycf46/Vps4 family AAA+-type ATPase